MYEILNLYAASRQTDGGVDETRGCPRPARNPAGAVAGPEIYPRVWPRAGFPLPHGFGHGRVFAKPVPAPVGAIPTHTQAVLPVTCNQVLQYLSIQCDYEG